MSNAKITIKLYNPPATVRRLAESDKIGKLYVDPITGKGAFYDKDYGFWSRPGVPKVPTNIPLNYSKEQNPLATSHWEVPAFEMYKNIVAQSVSEYIRRNV